MKFKNFRYPKAILVFILFVFGNLVISFVIQLLFALEIISYHDLKLFLSLTFVLPILLIHWLFRFEVIYPKFETNLGFYFLTLILALSIQFLATALEIMSFSFIPERFHEYYYHLKEFLFPKDEKDLWLSLFTIGFVAPISEEYFFRGIILSNLVKYHSPSFSNILQALLFGFAHLNPFQVLYAFPIGILFGYLYLKTKNLWIPMVLHIFVNSISLIFSFVEFPSFLGDYLEPFVDPNAKKENLPFEVLLLSTLILIYSLYAIPRKYPKKD
ncbi:MAG: CPBP family intramembrane metalloprotease [Leptospiraceae bacterium]|nr:CPBP family intramembrane metalloprotease [Leptospiraceae bacterium]MDW7975426.1 type II CAAX endopeptidase family protein [Leptospiraceae bacterium]